MPSHAHCPLKQLHTAESSYNQIPGWSPKIQKEFDEDFVRLLVANGNAWRMADNPQTKIWMEKWSRGPPSSGRKKLSRAVLDAEVLKAENRVREKIVGKVGTGTCDGWKNKAKKSVVSTMLMVKNEVREFPCRNDGLLTWSDCTSCTLWKLTIWLADPRLEMIKGKYDYKVIA